MITKEKEKAVEALCRYVCEYCEENGLSVFMSVAASEDKPDGLEQKAGSVVSGRTDHIVGQLSATAKSNDRIGRILSVSLMQALTRKADINVISVGGGKSEHELMNVVPEMKSRMKANKERLRKRRACRPAASSGNGSYGPGVYMNGVLITSVCVHEHE